MRIDFKNNHTQYNDCGLQYTSYPWYKSKVYNLHKKHNEFFTDIQVDVFLTVEGIYLVKYCKEWLMKIYYYTSIYTINKTPNNEYSSRHFQYGLYAGETFQDLPYTVFIEENGDTLEVEKSWNTNGCISLHSK